MRMDRCMLYFIACVFPETHWGWNQAQRTLDLVRECSRFVSAFFDVINLSAPHIYHSALSLSPSTSVIRRLYKQYAMPLARVVRGLSLSWELAVATVYVGPGVTPRSGRTPPPRVIWSPCSKFIAASTTESVKILDAVTLNQLSTFKHPLDYSHFSFSPDSRSLALFTSSELISWDVQTGGRLSEILPKPGERSPDVTSFTYSQDGKMVAVAGYKHFYTFDLPSSTRLGPLPVPDGRLVLPIWTCDEYLRFAIIHPGSITIWEVEFTLKHPPTQLESFSIPDEVVDGHNFLFLPILYRLAFTLRDTIQVRDVKASKLLLKSKRVPDSYPTHSFSSDGCFFAFTTGEVHVWKESPAGYALHQQFHPLLDDLERPFLSPNGRSIIFPFDGTINLWHTSDQTLSPPIPPTEEHHPQHHFLLAFSPNEKSAAFAQLYGNVVTILDLRSGGLRLTINTDMEVNCLGVAEDTVVVADEGMVVTWNLPDGDRAFNASTDDSVRTVQLGRDLFGSQPLSPDSVPSLSPDLSCIAIVQGSFGPEGLVLVLKICDVTTGTGMWLASTKLYSRSSPRFTRDGHEVWMPFVHPKRGWEMIETGRAGGRWRWRRRRTVTELKFLGEETLRPWGTFFHQSPDGYQITDDGWVLSPTRKRLLWLPHRWRSGQEEYRLWSGRFLGLSHRLSEVVILEFLE